MEIVDEIKTDESRFISKDCVQLCGFKIGEAYYAIPVLDVQEVIKPQKLTKVPLAAEYIDGLINLRGQIVTAINLKKLFGLELATKQEDHMNIIVRSEDCLYSLVVDEILDVMDVESSSRENTPDSLSPIIRSFISGVYKLEDKLLILLSLEKIFEVEQEGDSNDGK